MQKPTSRIVAEIIEFVTQQPNVSKVLNRRDTHPSVACTQIACKFYKHHPSDPGRSAYDVVFGYYTKDDDLEKNDDVLVRVQVSEGSPPSFKILNVRYF